VISANWNGPSGAEWERLLPKREVFLCRGRGPGPRGDRKYQSRWSGQSRWSPVQYIMARTVVPAAADQLDDGREIACDWRDATLRLRRVQWKQVGAATRAPGAHSLRLRLGRRLVPWANVRSAGRTLMCASTHSCRPASEDRSPLPFLQPIRRAQFGRRCGHRSKRRGCARARRCAAERCAIRPDPYRAPEPAAMGGS